MTMLVAYVAGPYRATHLRSVDDHIAAARRVAVELWRRGYAVVCPHLNTAHFDGVVDDAVFLAGDLAILDRCDLVVMAPRWEESEGARGERERAARNGQPVYHHPDLPPALPGADRVRGEPPAG
jgi:Domain of unknown function (DUF4406)